MDQSAIPDDYFTDLTVVHEHAACQSVLSVSEVASRPHHFTPLLTRCLTEQRVTGSPVCLERLAPRAAFR